MPQPPNEEAARRARQRLQSFLDCIADLLAQRWLRECRQPKEPPIPPQHGPPTDKTP